MTDAQWIRLKSTDDSSLISDETIALILAEYSDETAADRRKLALADVYEYMCRDDVYASYSRGGISVGQNLLRQRALDLRAEVGVTITTSTLVHAEYHDA